MNNIYIYLFDGSDGLDADFAADNMHELPAFRREQCAKYRKAADKNACVLAYLLLKKGLREQYGVSDPPVFTYNKYDKPYLSDAPHIFFNFSHCRQAVVCALADFETGIDIQDVRPYDETVSRRICTGDEMRQLEACDDPARMFCRFWVRKESYAKAKGIGIASVLKQQLPESGFITFDAERYCVSLFQYTDSAEPAVNIIPCRLPIR